MGLPKLKDYWTVEEYLEFDWMKLTYSDLQSEIHFDSIRIKISLADIYRRVRFSENILEMEREERQEREER
jgi:hypothetical protein